MKEIKNLLFIAAAFSITTVLSSAGIVQPEPKYTIIAQQNTNVSIVGNGTFNPNASAPVNFTIQLTGALAGKQIDSPEWVVPGIWEIGNIPNQTIQIYYKPGATAGYLKVSFKIDGNTYTAQKFLTISSHP